MLGGVLGEWVAEGGLPSASRGQEHQVAKPPNPRATANIIQGTPLFIIFITFVQPIRGVRLQPW